MDHRHLIEAIQHVSLAMFRKNFFGVFHGSISARMHDASFLINTRDAILDAVDEATLVELECGQYDYRWNHASDDARIHEQIYREIPHAKAVACAMPPYASAYMLDHETFTPRDYYGVQLAGTIPVLDAHPFDTWHARAPHAIADCFSRCDSHLILVRGYGVVAYDRDMHRLAKTIAVLENSARLLALARAIP